MAYSIGIDLGGTKIAGGIVRKDGEILYKISITTPQKGRTEVLQALHQMIQELLQWTKNHQIEEIAGIGIGTAGQIDFVNGRVLSGTTNIADWNDVPIREALGKHTSLPIWVDNDVNVVAIAENQLGAARGESDIVCLALGTGVGGGVISNGRLIRGSWGAAAELGHVSLDWNGPDCNCGLKGCLEVYASGSGIARMYRERLADSSFLGSSAITSHLVFNQYHKGDPLALEVIETMTTALAYGIVNFIHTFNPTTIILGGGVMSNGSWILRLVEHKVKHLGLRSLVDPVKLRLAELGPEAGIIGAAYQSWLYNKDTLRKETI